MKLLSLEQAVNRVRLTLRGGDPAEPPAGGSPYFFMVGAGISFPSVPLAGEIQRQAKARARREGVASGAEPSDPAARYMHWIEQAYPDPEQRRRYFHGLIRGKPLNDANLRLAQLLISREITNLVVTPNFDDFLSRALSLFGEPHIICDHPATTLRIDLRSEELQIVHAHGSHWFYDLVNTRAEIAATAQGVARRRSGMASFLDALLSQRSPLVIGYSGWEGDVFMGALRRRLEGQQLRHNLYWFCFSRPAPGDLPAWMVEHPNVYLVVPEKEDRRLTADETLEAMLHAFKVPPPQLMRDPLGFYVEALRRSIPALEPDETARRELYFLGEVLARLERAQALEARERRAGALEHVLDAVRRADYREVAEVAASMDLEALEPAQREALMEALWSAAHARRPSAEAKAEAYALFLRKAEACGEGFVEVHRGRMAAAHVGLSYTLVKLGAHARALEAIEEGIAHIRKASAHEMPRAVAQLTLIRARALAGLERYEEALAAIESLEKRAEEDERSRIDSVMKRAFDLREEIARKRAGASGPQGS